MTTAVRTTASFLLATQSRPRFVGLAYLTLRCLNRIYPGTSYDRNFHSSSPIFSRRFSIHIYPLGPARLLSPSRVSLPCRRRVQTASSSRCNRSDSLVSAARSLAPSRAAHCIANTSSSLADPTNSKRCSSHRFQRILEAFKSSMHLLGASRAAQTRRSLSCRGLGRVSAHGRARSGPR